MKNFIPGKLSDNGDSKYNLSYKRGQQPADPFPLLPRNAKANLEILLETGKEIR